MSTFLDPPGPDRSEVDLAAVAHDAELLDRLAVRTTVPHGDAVAALLAAFAAEVDEGLDAVLSPDAADPRVASLVDAATVAAPPAEPTRRHGLRTTTVAIVLGATLSVGGVAAAVTGDPLAPVKGLATAVGLTDPKPDLPEAASPNAKINHVMVGLAREIAQGRLDGVQARIDQVRAMLDDPALTGGQRTGLLKRLAALQAKLDRAQAKAAATNLSGRKPDTPGRVGGIVVPGKSGTSGKAPDGTPSGGSGGKKAPPRRAQPDQARSQAGTTTQAPVVEGSTTDGGSADTGPTQAPGRGRGQGAGGTTGRSNSGKG